MDLIVVYFFFKISIIYLSIFNSRILIFEICILLYWALNFLVISILKKLTSLLLLIINFYLLIIEINIVIRNILKYLGLYYLDILLHLLFNIRRIVLIIYQGSIIIWLIYLVGIEKFASRLLFLIIHAQLAVERNVLNNNLDRQIILDHLRCNIYGI